MAIINDKVQVIVRIRPPKLTSRDQVVVTVTNSNTIFVKEKSFSFDAIYDSFTDQTTIFNESIKPLINQFLSGINTTIFAYGQTGAGKTFTMGTNQNDLHFQDCNCGIIPRFLFEIFQLRNSREEKFEFSIQFLELYNEEIRDLLTARGESANMRIVDSRSASGGAHVAGLTDKTVASAIEALFYLNEGNKSRTTGFTAMNSESSRSHSIFTFHMTQTKFNKITNCTETIKSKFNFVDLAGSERLQRTKSVGMRAKEGISINFGLLALGNVICALSEHGHKFKRHIPYRDSKLTRLLEDSLGGNSKCMMIACICPLAENLMETCNTLTYASRARSIENKITINQKLSSNSEHFCANCYKLQQQINQLKSNNHFGNTESMDSKFMKEMKEIFESQRLNAKESFEHSIANFDSLCYLVSLEHDLKCLECLPDHLPCQNNQLALEKMVFSQKIKSTRSFSMSDTFIENSNKSILNDFIDQMSKETNKNWLKMKSVAQNAKENEMSSIKNHEFRWNFLLNFVCQQFVLKDCLQQEMIKLYEEQFSKFYTIFKNLLVKFNVPQSTLAELISQIKQPNSYINDSSLQSHHLTDVLKNLENDLTTMFPLTNESDVNVIQTLEEMSKENKYPKSILKKQEDFHLNNSSECLGTEIKKPESVDTLKRHKTVYSLKRKRSITLKQKGKILNGEFIKPDGLCLPIISSTVKTQSSNIFPHTTNHATLESFNNQNKYKIIPRPIFSENIVDNFRKRNLLSKWK